MRESVQMKLDSAWFATNQGIAVTTQGVQHLDKLLEITKETEGEWIV